MKLLDCSIKTYKIDTAPQEYYFHAYTKRSNNLQKKPRTFCIPKGLKPISSSPTISTETPAFLLGVKPFTIQICLFLTPRRTKQVFFIETQSCTLTTNQRLLAAKTYYYAILSRAIFTRRKWLANCDF